MCEQLASPLEAFVCLQSYLKLEQLYVGGGNGKHQQSTHGNLQQAPTSSIWPAGDVTEQGATKALEQGLDPALSASILAAESSPDPAEEQPGQVSPQAAGHACSGAARMAAIASSKHPSAMLAGPPGQHPVQ